MSTEDLEKTSFVGYVDDGAVTLTPVLGTSAALAWQGALTLRATDGGWTLRGADENNDAVETESLQQVDDRAFFEVPIRSNTPQTCVVEVVVGLPAEPSPQRWPWPISAFF